MSTAVGDEGGFAPNLEGTEDALNSILAAIKVAGYEPGKDVMIGMDCASSEFYHDGIYDYAKFEGEKGKNVQPRNRLIIWRNLSTNIRLILSKTV